MSDIGLYGAMPYGQYGYKWGETETQLHFWALRKVNPLRAIACDSSSDPLYADYQIEGRMLDQAYYRAAGDPPDAGTDCLKTEIFPNTATYPGGADSSGNIETGGLLNRWLLQYDLTDPHNTVVAQGLVTAACRTLCNKSGRLTKAYYIAQAAAMGYTVSISEGSEDMFIVASTCPPASALPHALYESTHLWVWTMIGLSAIPASARAAYEAHFQALKPAFTELRFSYYY